MTAINDVTTLEIDGEIAVVTLNSPPVNALSAPVREGITNGVKAAIDNDAVKAIVLICEGKTFIAGADITEFGKAPKGPSLFDALQMIEFGTKPVVAAIHGTALGGGLEVALTSRWASSTSWPKRASCARAPSPSRRRSSPRSAR